MLAIIVVENTRMITPQYITAVAVIIDALYENVGIDKLLLARVILVHIHYRSDVICHSIASILRAFYVRLSDRLWWTRNIRRR